MKSTINNRISRVQEELTKQNIDGWIITGTDPHQTEYLPPHWMERQGITGFSGSAGTVVVLQDAIHLWVDSRYYVQAAREVEGTSVEIHKFGLPEVLSYGDWLKAEMPKGSVIGVDSMTISFKGFLDLQKELEGAGITLQGMENIFLPLWEDRPNPPEEQVVSLDSSYTGETREERLAWAYTYMEERKSDVLLSTNLAEIGYLLNLRGTVQQYNPVFEGFLIISRNPNKQAILCTHIEAFSKELQAELGESVTLLPYDSVYGQVEALQGTVIIDPTSAPYGLITKFQKSVVGKEITPHPITTRKAVKTETEKAQLREAHKLDGVAMANFLHWFDSIEDKSTLTEWDTMEKIKECRSAQKGFTDESFATIAGYQENGVLNHYHASKELSAPLSGQGLMVFDSGGQYLCGTTDITRTLLIGEPTEEQVSDYTAVLKGHIALATAQFPVGTFGHQIDILARKPLWDVGLNYGHGTGHGVGFFMNVHEGPMSISPKGINVALEAGQYLSNEPGLYREGKHGIRLENLVLVEKRETTEFAQWLGFETLTITPFERKLINTDALTAEEKDWLNDYHAGVYAELAPLLAEPVQEWLAEATAEV